MSCYYARYLCCSLTLERQDGVIFALFFHWNFVTIESFLQDERSLHHFFVLVRHVGSIVRAVAPAIMSH